MSASVLDHHLATCADCARWIEAATRLTRHTRVGTADTPDLVDPILDDAVLPIRRVLRGRRWLRVALVVVGLAQLGVALPSLFGGSIDMAMSTHAAHETAAWNVALGAAFVATALRPRRASGEVAAGRLATHLGIVAELALVYALARAEQALPPNLPAAVADDAPDREQGSGLRGVA